MKNLKLPLAMLAMLSFITIGHAVTVPTATTRISDASAPNFSHYSPNNLSLDSVLPDLERMMGKPSREDAAGPDNSNWQMYSYKLADGTLIIAQFGENQDNGSMDLTKIVEESPSGKLTTTYFTQNR